jgi:hypothetical protein
MRPLSLGHPIILPAEPVNYAKKKNKYINVTVFLAAVTWSCAVALLVSDSYSTLDIIIMKTMLVSQLSEVHPSLTCYKAIKALEMATVVMRTPVHPAGVHQQNDTSSSSQNLSTECCYWSNWLIF